eukprot:366009-Chlamydomonas_euryale.AAC.28
MRAPSTAGSVCGPTEDVPHCLHSLKPLAVSFMPQGCETLRMSDLYSANRNLRPCPHFAYIQHNGQYECAIHINVSLELSFGTAHTTSN